MIWVGQNSVAVTLSLRLKVVYTPQLKNVSFVKDKIVRIKWSRLSGHNCGDQTTTLSIKFNVNHH